MTTDAPADERLLAPYRVIRRVLGPPDAPVAGTLVRTPDGESMLLARAEALGDQWPGWFVEPTDHVLAPADVVRRADGHDVVLPHCTERLAAFLERRLMAGAPLADGEAVTLAVSLLRGVGRLRALDLPTTGVWWLTDAGRPVVAPGPADAHDARALLTGLAADRRVLASALTLAVDAIDADSARLMADAEDELFACITPAPLDLAPVTGRPVGMPAPARALTAEPTDVPAPRSWLDVMARHVDADLGDAVSVATTAVWRRLSRPREGARRVRPVAAALGVGAIVLAAGLLWPTDSSPSAAEVGATSTPAAAMRASADPAATGAAGEHDSGPDDLVGIASQLLDERLACGDDDTCLADVVESIHDDFPVGATGAAHDDRRVLLLDDFGDAAVLRVEAVDDHVTTQLVVIVRSGDVWLLRDVHDVAEQP